MHKKNKKKNKKMIITEIKHLNVRISEFEDSIFDENILPVFSTPLILKEVAARKKSKYKIETLNPEKKLTFRIVSFNEIVEELAARINKIAIDLEPHFFIDPSEPNSLPYKVRQILDENKLIDEKKEIEEAIRRIKKSTVRGKKLILFARRSGLPYGNARQRWRSKKILKAMVSRVYAPHSKLLLPLIRKQDIFKYRGGAIINLKKLDLLRDNASVSSLLCEAPASMLQSEAILTLPLRKNHQAGKLRKLLFAGWIPTSKGALMLLDDEGWDLDLLLNKNSISQRLRKKRPYKLRKLRRLRRLRRLRLISINLYLHRSRNVEKLQKAQDWQGRNNSKLNCGYKSIDFYGNKGRLLRSRASLNAVEGAASKRVSTARALPAYAAVAGGLNLEVEGSDLSSRTFNPSAADYAVNANKSLNNKLFIKHNDNKLKFIVNWIGDNLTDFGSLSTLTAKRQGQIQLTVAGLETQQSTSSKALHSPALIERQNVCNPLAHLPESSVERSAATQQRLNKKNISDIFLVQYSQAIQLPSLELRAELEPENKKDAVPSLRASSAETEAQLFLQKKMVKGARLPLSEERQRSLPYKSNGPLTWPAKPTRKENQKRYVGPTLSEKLLSLSNARVINRKFSTFASSITTISSIINSDKKLKVLNQFSGVAPFSRDSALCQKKPTQKLTSGAKIVAQGRGQQKYFIKNDQVLLLHEKNPVSERHPLLCSNTALRSELFIWPWNSENIIFLTQPREVEETRQLKTINSKVANWKKKKNRLLAVLLYKTSLNSVNLLTLGPRSSAIAQQQFLGENFTAKMTKFKPGLDSFLQQIYLNKIKTSATTGSGSLAAKVYKARVEARHIPATQISTAPLLGLRSQHWKKIASLLNSNVAPSRAVPRLPALRLGQKVNVNPGLFWSIIKLYSSLFNPMLKSLNNKYLHPGLLGKGTAQLKILKNSNDPFTPQVKSIKDMFFHPTSEAVAATKPAQPKKQTSKVALLDSQLKSMAVLKLNKVEAGYKPTAPTLTELLHSYEEPDKFNLFFAQQGSKGSNAQIKNKVIKYLIPKETVANKNHKHLAPFGKIGRLPYSQSQNLRIFKELPARPLKLKVGSAAQHYSNVLRRQADSKRFLFLYFIVPIFFATLKNSTLKNLNNQKKQLRSLIKLMLDSGSVLRNQKLNLSAALKGWQYSLACSGLSATLKPHDRTSWKLALAQPALAQPSSKLGQYTAASPLKGAAKHPNKVRQNTEKLINSKVSGGRLSNQNLNSTQIILAKDINFLMESLNLNIFKKTSALPLVRRNSKADRFSDTAGSGRTNAGNAVIYDFHHAADLLKWSMLFIAQSLAPLKRKQDYYSLILIKILETRGFLALNNKANAAQLSKIESAQQVVQHKTETLSNKKINKKLAAISADTFTDKATSTEAVITKVPFLSNTINLEGVDKTAVVASAQHKELKAGQHANRQGQPQALAAQQRNSSGRLAISQPTTSTEKQAAITFYPGGRFISDWKRVTKVIWQEKYKFNAVYRRVKNSLNLANKSINIKFRDWYAIITIFKLWNIIKINSFKYLSLFKLQVLFRKYPTFLSARVYRIKYLATASKAALRMKKSAERANATLVKVTNQNKNKGGATAPLKGLQMQERSLSKKGAARLASKARKLTLKVAALLSGISKLALRKKAKLLRIKDVTLRTAELFKTSTQEVNFLDKLKFSIINSILKVLVKKPAAQSRRSSQTILRSRRKGLADLTFQSFRQDGLNNACASATSQNNAWEHDAALAHFSGSGEELGQLRKDGIFKQGEPLQERQPINNRADRSQNRRSQPNFSLFDNFYLWVWTQVRKSNYQRRVITGSASTYINYNLTRLVKKIDSHVPFIFTLSKLDPYKKLGFISKEITLYQVLKTDKMFIKDGAEFKSRINKVAFDPQQKSALWQASLGPVLLRSANGCEVKEEAVQPEPLNKIGNNIASLAVRQAANSLDLNIEFNKNFNNLVNAKSTIIGKIRSIKLVELIDKIKEEIIIAEKLAAMVRVADITNLNLVNKKKFRRINASKYLNKKIVYRSNRIKILQTIETIKKTEFRFEPKLDSNALSNNPVSLLYYSNLKPENSAQLVGSNGNAALSTSAQLRTKEGLHMLPLGMHSQSTVSGPANFSAEQKDKSQEGKEKPTVISAYLRELSIYNRETKGIINYFSKIVGYNFNTNTNKISSTIIDLLEASFKAMRCLISKPVFVITPEKITIELFYFLLITNKKQLKKIRNRFKYKNKRTRKTYTKFRLKETKSLNSVSLNKLFPEQFKLLCGRLNKIFNKPVELNLIRLHYPSEDTNILVNLMGIIINKVRLNLIFRKLFKGSIIKTLTKVKAHKYNDISIIPAFLTGLSIKVAGRILTQTIRPRKTISFKRRGATARGKINYLNFARLTNKNKRGSYSITISAGQNYFK